MFNMQQLSSELIDDSNSRCIRVHLLLEAVVAVLHDLNVLDVLSWYHRLEHAVFLADPLFDTIALGEQLVERKSIEKALLPQFG